MAALALSAVDLDLVYQAWYSDGWGLGAMQREPQQHYCLLLLQHKYRQYVETPSPFPTTARITRKRTGGSPCP